MGEPAGLPSVGSHRGGHDWSDAAAAAAAAVAEKVKDLPACGRPECDPWVGKIPWRRDGSPLQYSCLENSMERGACWATVHEVANSWTRLSN